MKKIIENEGFVAQDNKTKWYFKRISKYLQEFFESSTVGEVMLTKSDPNSYDREPEEPCSVLMQHSFYLNTEKEHIQTDEILYGDVVFIHVSDGFLLRVKNDFYLSNNPQNGFSGRNKVIRMSEYLDQIKFKYGENCCHPWTIASDKDDIIEDDYMHVLPKKLLQKDALLEFIRFMNKETNYFALEGILSYAIEKCANPDWFSTGEEIKYVTFQKYINNPIFIRENGEEYVLDEIMLCHKLDANYLNNDYKKLIQLYQDILKSSNSSQ